MESTERVERVRYRFIGHVQGRGFRFACVTCARKDELTGWVRNERDGTVTAEVQGIPEGHASFLRCLTALVTGFGNDWSIGSERAVALVEGESSFGVRRY